MQFQLFSIFHPHQRKGRKKYLKPKVNTISEAGSELNNLQDVNSQSFDCHNQPISKPANYLYILKYVVNDSAYFFLKKQFRGSNLTLILIA
ncbi:hypothetical protein Avbf_18830 [Armadillidium vulgare]|nr:hypothetical protein Avbf_18830 [Armadillidium vulgare]